MLIKACVFILCLGIVVIIGGLAMLCCMNKEEAGAKTMLAGFLLSSLGGGMLIVPDSRCCTGHHCRANMCMLCAGNDSDKLISYVSDFSAY